MWVKGDMRAKRGKQLNPGRSVVWGGCCGASHVACPAFFSISICNSHIPLQDDLLRTFGHNDKFGGGQGPNIASTRRVLWAFAWHNPNIGYCQVREVKGPV